MKEEQIALLETSLKQIPKGSFEVLRHGAAGFQNPQLPQQLITHTQGKGRMESYPVFDGIEVSFCQYLAEQIEFHHQARASVLEMDYCQNGRIGWNMQGGGSVYLGPGDLCLHSMASCADSKMVLPLGYYQGISITVDLQLLETDCPAILEEAGFSAQQIRENFCAGNKPAGIPASPATEAIFGPLCRAPKALLLPYCQLKAQEALLYLLQLKPEGEKELTQYGSQQTELIKEIRDFLVQHLDQRFTIEELAKTYLINTSSLKSIFKAVYGMPIASYVKEYRMQQAMKLLRQTEDSIAVIAQKVGYETQGKFTKAFKERVQLLPKEYRKLYRT